MRVYLDNNATTRIHPAVLERLTGIMRDAWGNASSIHREGQISRRILEESREQVAALIHAAPNEVVFTSGGTESNNAAIHGSVLLSSLPCHIVTTSIEHPSVLEPTRELARRGHEVTYVGCDRNGFVTADHVLAAVRPETRFVSMMLANNETGVIQPVAEVGRFCRDKGIHFHCDAVQAAGRLDIEVNDLYADTLSLSAHKMHAPKGIGALYVRRGVVLSPILSGGMQERRRRAGTENVPMAAAFGTAATLAVETLQDMPRLEQLRDSLEEQLRTQLPFITVNGGAGKRLANTTNVRFRGSDGESLVIALDLNGVAVSTGSACSSGRMEPSHVLLEMGLTEEEAKSSLRFSLSQFTTSEDIQKVVTLLRELVPLNQRVEIIRSA